MTPSSSTFPSPATAEANASSNEAKAAALKELRAIAYGLRYFRLGLYVGFVFNLAVGTVAARWMSGLTPHSMPWSWMTCMAGAAIVVGGLSLAMAGWMYPRLATLKRGLALAAPWCRVPAKPSIEEAIARLEAQVAAQPEALGVETRDPIMQAVRPLGQASATGTSTHRP